MLNLTLRICGAVASLICAGKASGQTASQVTPKSLAPQVQQSLSAGFAVPSWTGLTTPDGADKLFISTGPVVIEDGFADLETANEALTHRLAYRRVSAAELFEAARVLEAAYVKAGYVLVRVVVPPQTLANGSPVHIRVIDGIIERIDAKTLPPHLRPYIEAALAPVAGQHRLKIADIERRLLLAGDMPGLVLRSTLAPGAAPGTSVLVIEGTYRPVNALFTLDNTMTSSLGRYQAGISFDLNSLFGFGELIYVRGNGAPNFGNNGFLMSDPRYQLLSAGFILPIGLEGLTFNGEGTEARTTPEPASGIASADLFQRLSIRLRYPWLRRRDLDFATGIEFDAQDETNNLLLSGGDQPISEDRLRILRFTGESRYVTPWSGTLSLHLTASFGLDAFGARTAQDATPLLPLSRQGTDANFSKIETTFDYSQKVLEHLAFDLTAHGQSSLGQALAHSEQIGIAGPSGLSAFDAGTLQGDSGIAGRCDILSPFEMPLLAGAPEVAAAPYIFVAAGALFLQQPTALERANTIAGAYGIGLRLNEAVPDIISSSSLALEFARQIRSDGVAIGNRFTLVSGFKF